MPADAKAVSVNLLQRTDSEHTAVGRITTWAVTYGRYIMIGTEIVVLLAFIARFSLDRKLTDLKEEISQKQAIITANAGFEQDIRNIQDRLSKIKTTATGQTKPIDLFTVITSSLPPDVYISTLDYSVNRLSIEAIAGSSEGFSQFLAVFAATPGVRDVEIGDIQKQPNRGIQFKVSALIGAPPAPVKAPVAK